MREIVVGVDESDDAALALRWAAREAQLREARLVVVLAWGYIEQYRGIERFEPHIDEADARISLEKFVASVLGPDGDTANTDVQMRAVDGFAPTALVEAGENAELLVVGTRGRGGFLGLRLGSVSRHCLHHAPCPVAIIRDGDRVLTDRPERIVVGYDGSETARAAVLWAIDEARLRGATVDVVHAWSVPATAAHPFSAAVFDPRLFESAGRKAVDALVDPLDTRGLGGPIERIVAPGAPAKVILDVANGADLVVLGSRGLGGFAGLLLGSVAQHVTVHAPCPVVVLRG